MEMKNKIFIILMLQTIIIGILSIKANVMAYNLEIISSTSVAAAVTNPADDPDSYKPANMNNADKVKDKGNKIIGIIQFIGSFVSVIALGVMGIKYMLGSVEEKAEYKKTMVPYVIGAILVFATSNLLGIVDSVSKGIFK